MAVTECIACIILGWVLAKLGDAVGLFTATQAHKERMAYFDKALTKGNPTDLYNLRMAEQVSRDENVVKAAVNTELSRHEPKQEPQATGLEPWSDDPLYGRCNITFDHARKVVIIIDPEAQDGPDFWEEPFEEFYAKFFN